MRATLLSLLLFLVILGGLWMTAESAPSAQPPGRVLRHIVMYKFKPELTAAEVQEVVDAFRGLPDKIDVIIGFEHGVNAGLDERHDGLTHVFVVTFRTATDLQTYLDHPAHLEYVKVVAPRRERLVVFDYWIDTPTAALKH